MDQGSGLAILGAALGSARLVEKILGPTADYLGVGVKAFTEKRLNNVNRILGFAAEKLGPDIEQDGEVPPKVLRDVLEDGSYCNDQLAAEYFGGVLASARTAESRDDRGATFTSLVGRMTTYQVRAHYIIYSVLRKLYLDRGLSPTVKNQRPSMRTFIPYTVLNKGMEFSNSENPLVILEHCLFGLEREWLVQNNFLMGTLSEMQKHCNAAEDGGVLVTPSAFGAELFLWVNGHGKMHPAYTFSSNVDFIFKTEVDIPDGSQVLQLKSR